WDHARGDCEVAQFGAEEQTYIVENRFVNRRCKTTFLAVIATCSLRRTGASRASGMYHHVDGSDRIRTQVQVSGNGWTMDGHQVVETPWLALRLLFGVSLLQR